MMIYLLTGILTLLEHQSQGYGSKPSLSRIGTIFYTIILLKLPFGKELKNKRRINLKKEYKETEITNNSGEEE